MAWSGRWRAEASGGAFSVTGNVDGLYPGVHLALTARVENPYAFVIAATITGVVVGDGPPGCPGSFVRFTDLGSSVTVAAGAAGFVQLALDMDRAAPDACQGADFPLTFQAVAVTTAAPPQVGPVPVAPTAGAGMPATGIDVALLVLGAALVSAGGAVLRRFGAGRRRVPR